MGEKGQLAHIREAAERGTGDENVNAPCAALLPLVLLGPAHDGAAQRELFLLRHPPRQLCRASVRRAGVVARKLGRRVRVPVRHPASLSRMRARNFWRKLAGDRAQLPFTPADCSTLLLYILFFPRDRRASIVIYFTDSIVRAQ
jgi:hypothetical protein